MQTMTKPMMRPMTKTNMETIIKNYDETRL